MSTKQVFESIEQLPQNCRTALRDLLLAISDTKLLLGYHYGEWTFGPPQLEAAVACCSLCQSELGHVRLLHGLLNKHFGDDPDALVEQRKPNEFANISYLDNEIKDWPHFVAANYFVDLAVTTVLDSLKGSTFRPLQMSLDKMLQEERYHIHHGQGWLRTMGSKNKQAQAAVETSAERALHSIMVWFGPDDSAEDGALTDAGIKATPMSESKAKYLQAVQTLAKDLKLNLEIGNGGAVDWKKWRFATRRASATGPDEQILYHLRGSKNKVFKLN